MYILLIKISPLNEWMVEKMGDELGMVLVNSSWSMESIYSLRMGIPLTTHLQDMKIFTTFWFWVTCPNTSKQSFHLQTGRCSGAAKLLRTGEQKGTEVLCLKCFVFFPVRMVFLLYLFCALVGGVTQIFSSTLFGPMDTGVLGFVAPFPDKQAVFNGEQDLRFVLRHDRLRNKSLLRTSTRTIEKWKQIQCRTQRNLTQWQTTNLDFSGFSSFNRIWDKSPTKSSSTLWLMPTDVSMNLQSYAVAIAFPSEHPEKNASGIKNFCYPTYFPSEQEKLNGLFNSYLRSWHIGFELNQLYFQLISQLFVLYSPMSTATVWFVRLIWNWPDRPTNKWRSNRAVRSS